MGEIKRLPDELLSTIFDMLPAPVVACECAQVCRRWEAVSRRRVLLVRAARQLPLLRRSQRALLVLAPPACSRALLAAAPDLVPQLTHLTVHAAAPITLAQFAALALFPHLVHLDVFASTHVLYAKSLPWVGRLTTLVLNDTVAPGMLRALSASTRLCELHMYGRALHYPHRELPLVLRSRRDHLRQLTLRCPQLTDVAYEAIGACPNLEALRLYSCWLLSGRGARSAVSGPRLRRLHITGAPMLRGSSIVLLLDALPPRLEELVLSGTQLGDEHVELLATRTPHLKTLEAWRSRLTAPGALRLANMLHELHGLDLDLILGVEQLEQLANHGSLQWVRCERGAGVGARCGRLSVKSAHERFARRYFRASGEGYCGSLMYYWTRDRPLAPRPPRLPPGCHEHDDTFN